MKPKSLAAALLLVTLLPAVASALPARERIQERTIPSDGAGTTPAETITPKFDQIRITCEDPDDCAITISTSLMRPPLKEVEVLCLTNFEPQTCNFSNTSTVVLSAASVELGHRDVLTLTYEGDGVWLQKASSNNAPPTATPTPTPVATATPTPATIAVASAYSGDTGTDTTTTLTIPNVVCSGSNKLLLVGTCVRADGDQTVTGITKGATGLTQIDTSLFSTFVRADIWKLVDPSASSESVTITTSANARFSAGAVCLTGVDQSTPNDTAAKATGGPDTTATVDVTGSAVGDLVVDAACKRSGDETVTIGADQTLRWDDETTHATAGNNVNALGSTQAGSASAVTMSWTWSGSNRQWSTVAVSVNPVP